MEVSIIGVFVKSFIFLMIMAILTVLLIISSIFAKKEDKRDKRILNEENEKIEEGIKRRKEEWEKLTILFKKLSETNECLRGEYQKEDIHLLRKDELFSRISEFENVKMIFNEYKENFNPGDLSLDLGGLSSSLKNIEHSFDTMQK